MSNKELAQRWFEEVWNQRNSAMIEELMAPDVVGRTETGEVKGPADFRRLVYDPIRQAFPDIRIKIDALIGEGNEVAMRWTAFAKHAGELAGLAATGRSVRMSGMTWVEFRDGKIVRGYDSYNLHGLMAYLSSGQESASVGPA